ncbi:MAG TPA: hypothetical protein PLO89_02615 [Spirochaetota bacterium]|nr:hypothetical protein [Spirochaetota bacterium]
MKKIIFFILSVASFYLHSQNAITYVPYQGKMKEIKTKHFVVIFPDKYSAIGLKVADYAEEIHERLKEFIKWTPQTKTNVILSDETDYPNGLANVMLRNTIVLYLSPSDLEETLKSFNDPLYSLIVHEYTHILHLDQIRGGAFFWRVIFGKLYHPVINTFKWYIEGVAVLSETRNSKGGRLQSAYNRALIREAAKNKKIPDYDKLVFPVVDFPHGDAVYHFGAKFIEYLYDTYGKEKFDEIYLKISDDFWPFVLMFNMNFKNIYGKSLKDLWAEWIKNEEILEQNDNFETIPPNNSQLTFFEGEINDFDIKKDALLISSVSLKNDKYLYLSTDKNLKKIRNQSFRSVTFTNDEDYIVYTKASRYFDERIYFDLYSFNLKTKKEKKLSNKERVNYVAFSKEKSVGVLVSHSPFGSKFFKASFKSGFISNKVELIVPDDIYFIDKPTIDKNGTKSIISCKTKSGKIKIFLVDLLKNKFIEIPDLKGRNPEFLNDNEFIFINEENGRTRIVKRNVDSGETKEILSSIGIFKAIASEDKIYYSKYTASGIEIFSCVTNKENEKYFETTKKRKIPKTKSFQKAFLAT